MAAPYNMIGMVYLAKGETKNAEKSFNMARKKNPGDVSSNFNLAMLAMQDNDLEKARGFYDEVLKHNPDHLLALLNLAELDGRENKNQAMVFET